MFTMLLESKGNRKTYSRCVPASAVIHAVLLAGVVTQSRPAQGREPEPDWSPKVVWVAPRPSERSGSLASASTGSVANTTRPARRMPHFEGAPAVDLPDIPLSTHGDVIGAGDVLSPTTSLGASDGRGASPGSADGPRWAAQVEKIALPLPGNPVPAYPGILRTAGIEGSVTLRFVIDTAGVVEPGSAVVVRSDHELFTAATLRALPTHRFLPAEVGGRKVRMLVEQRFEFAIDVGRKSPPR